MYEDINQGSKLPFAVTSNLCNILFIVLVSIFMVWYVEYHWKRRKLYRTASKINGPLALPIIGSALHFSGPTDDILNKVLRLCTQYQSPATVWFGSRLYFVIFDHKDMEIIMNNTLHKDDFYKYTEKQGGSGLFTAKLPKWKKHRKLIMPTFNQKVLDGFVEVFAEKSEILANVLENEAEKGVFDIFHYLGRCAIDTFCETAMGVTVNAQTTECEYGKWCAKAMEAMFVRMFNIIQQFDFIYERTKLCKEERYALDRMKEFTQSVIREKRVAFEDETRNQKADAESYIVEAQLKRNTFLQQLLQLSANGVAFTDEEIREEVDTFMLAGTETTAGTLSFAFIMLAMYPDIQEKVYQEVLEVIGTDTTVEYRDLIKLPYLEMVIKETMRVFPIGPVIARAVPEDIQLQSCTLPAGSSALLVIMHLHRDPKIWPDPLKFDPDRFLLEEVAKRHPYTWLPFSGGPRNCIGAKYAMMAMKTLIATVIRKYRFFTEYKNIEEIKLKAELTLKPSDGYKVSLELRE